MFSLCVVCVLHSLYCSGLLSQGIYTASAFTAQGFQVASNLTSAGINKLSEVTRREINTASEWTANATDAASAPFINWMKQSWTDRGSSGNVKQQAENSVFDLAQYVVPFTERVVDKCYCMTCYVSNWYKNLVKSCKNPPPPDQPRTVLQTVVATTHQFKNRIVAARNHLMKPLVDRMNRVKEQTRQSMKALAETADGHLVLYIDSILKAQVLVYELCENLFKPVLVACLFVMVLNSAHEKCFSRKSDQLQGRELWH